jgi:uncharacterized membrane protein YoaK (UPF0700 family)
MTTARTDKICRTEKDQTGEIAIMSTKSSTGPVKPVGRHLSDAGVRDRLLDALTVSSGAVDAISFLALGRVFSAFMTGNFAFLGMALAGNAGAPNIVAVLASMAGFAGGVYFGTRIVTSTRHTAAREGEQPPGVIWPRRATLTLGFSLLAHVCFVAIWLASSGRPSLSVASVLLTIWALAMGMQSAAVRILGLRGVFTTAATATFIFLISDLARGVLTSEECRRLVGVLASLAIGATAGGLLLIHVPLCAPVFPFAVTVGIVATAARVFGRDMNSDVTRTVSTSR